MTELEEATVKHEEEFEIVDKQLKQAHSSLDMRKSLLTDEVNTLEVSQSLRVK